MFRPFNLHKIFILKKKCFRKSSVQHGHGKNIISYALYLYKITMDDMDSSCSMHKADKKVDNTEF